MLHLARRNLFQNRIRAVVSVGGVALALMLVLALDAILTGMEQRLTLYIDRSGADLFVAQAGVRNMHMASSSLPARTVEAVARVPGVAMDQPILYLTNVMVVGDERALVYVIGVPAGATMGIPWQVTAGTPLPQPGSAVIDRGVAAAAGVGLGDRVALLGTEFTVGGLSAMTANMVNSIAFIPMEDFARLRRDAQTVSFVLVRVAPGVDHDQVAATIGQSVSGVTVQTRAGFSEQERRIVRDMSTDIVTIMNLVGLLIGLAVVGLTVYIAALARRAEYGMLKALGARNTHLYQVVIGQAGLSVVIGLAIGIHFTLALALLAPRLDPGLALRLSGRGLAKVSALALLIAVAAALLPIAQVGRLDPASVFRTGGRR